MKKPEHCQQDWLSMKPTEGGRICGKCEKKIIDFSGMSWAEIMRVQELNGFAACGMYSDKQLRHWGGEVPQGMGERWMKAAVLAAGLALGTAGMAQTSANSGGVTGSMIRGTVTGIAMGQVVAEPLIGAKVIVVGTDWGAFTDLDGNFTLTTPLSPEELATHKIQVRSIDFEDQEIQLGEYWKEKGMTAEDPMKVEMKTSVQMSVFYVREPTRREKRRWKREENKAVEGEE